MFSFAWWWLVAALPLPLIIRWLVPAAPARQEAALRVPFFNQLNTLPAAPSRALGGGRWLLVMLMWCALVLAAMRPQWIGDVIDTPLTGRDLMLGLDISQSMRERDFQLNGRSVERLDAAKVVAAEFISERQGDRVGLILFGDNAQVQTPLTYDLETVQHFLRESIVGLIGRSTAIGDAIGLAVKRLRQRPAESRVFILLTDGENTAGELEPVAAAELAQTLGIKIYTIGVGTKGQAPIPVRDPFSGRQRIRMMPVNIDEATLKQVAEITDGSYFRAVDTDSLTEIYKEIDLLEKTNVETENFVDYRELAVQPYRVGSVLGLASVNVWPTLLIALIFSVASVVLQKSWLRETV